LQDSRVQISALSFVEYCGCRNSRRIDIVNEQRSIYLSEDGKFPGYYQPVRTAMRKACNSTEPAREFDLAIGKANLRGQERAFTQIKQGFLPWLRRQGASGVGVTGTAWSVGDLDLKVTPHLGLRLPDGTALAIFAYLKEAALTRDAANVALRIMQRTVEHSMPGAVPLVLDVRRGKGYAVPARGDLARLDALIAAEAAGYVVHWRMAA
jgi:hypothetical protein